MADRYPTKTLPSERSLRLPSQQQNIAEIPVKVRELYKTAWEISQVRARTPTNHRSAMVCSRIPTLRFCSRSSFLVPRSSFFHAQKRCLDMAADRAPFIDQSQSLNVFVSSANAAKLTSMHFHAWKLGTSELNARSRAPSMQHAAPHGRCCSRHTPPTPTPAPVHF